MRRLWPPLRRYGLDALIVLAAAEAALAVALAGHTGQAPRSTHLFAVPAIALVALPLLWRRRFPFGAPAALWILGVAIASVDGRLVVYNGATLAAGLAAAMLLGSLADGARARLGLAIAVAGAALVTYFDPQHGGDELVFIPVLVAIAWLAGVALRERSQQAEVAEDRAVHAELERDATARIAVAEERARIARELHDVVAHALSVIVLHVGAVRHRLPESVPEEREALREVERAGRTALTEMRRLLGAMRREEDELELAPQPSLASLDALLEQVRRAGLPVEVHLQGTPAALPSGLELSAYRIIQEGLTNALKHAGASRVDVTVSYAADALELEVRDDGEGQAPGDGHGLLGIRERVKIYGGEMTAGRAPGRGFVLRTRLPLAPSGR